MSRYFQLSTADAWMQQTRSRCMVTRSSPHHTARGLVPYAMFIEASSCGVHYIARIQDQERRCLLQHTANGTGSSPHKRACRMPPAKSWIFSRVINWWPILVCGDKWVCSSRNDKRYVELPRKLALIGGGVCNAGGIHRSWSSGSLGAPARRMHSRRILARLCHAVIKKKHGWCLNASSRWV